MMRKWAAFLGVSLFASSSLAFSPTLRNEDSKSYSYEVKCSGSSLHSSISGNTSMSLSGHNGCSLIIPGAGSAQLADNLNCTIKNSTLICR
jgi:hypothetical protein